MALKDVLPKLRQERGMTQQELAGRLYVTRQAVSRWETGETVPGIDMTKLLAIALDVPVDTLLEMPGRFCQSCGMPLLDPSSQGTEADGSISPDFCSYCYQDGGFTYEADIDSMIERCAPFLVESAGVSLDEAVSFMGALLPGLKRWKDPHEEEARQLYGDEAVDAANARLDAMDSDELMAKNLLEESIKVQLRIAMRGGDARSEDSAELAHMHRRWIRLHWGDGYTREAHVSLAHGYLADPRFIDYYDGSCGEGATAFLVEALEANL